MWLSLHTAPFFFYNAQVVIYTISLLNKNSVSNQHFSCSLPFHLVVFTLLHHQVFPFADIGLVEYYPLYADCWSTNDTLFLLRQAGCNSSNGVHAGCLCRRQLRQFSKLMLALMWEQRLPRYHDSAKFWSLYRINWATLYSRISLLSTITVQFKTKKAAPGRQHGILLALSEKDDRGCIRCWSNPPRYPFHKLGGAM